MTITLKAKTAARIAAQDLIVSQGEPFWLEGQVEGVSGLVSVYFEDQLLSAKCTVDNTGNFKGPFCRINHYFAHAPGTIPGHPLSSSPAKDDVFLIRSDKQGGDFCFYTGPPKDHYDFHASCGSQESNTVTVTLVPVLGWSYEFATPTAKTVTEATTTTPTEEVTAATILAATISTAPTVTATQAGLGIAILAALGAALLFLL